MKVSLINGIEKTGIKLGPYFIHSKYFNVRFETKKVSKENIVENLLDVGLSNNFFGFDIKTQATETNINNLDYIKLKSLQRKQSTKGKAA